MVTDNILLIEAEETYKIKKKLHVKTTNRLTQNIELTKFQQIIIVLKDMFLCVNKVITR